MNHMGSMREREVQGKQFTRHPATKKKKRSYTLGESYQTVYIYGRVLTLAVCREMGLPIILFF